MSRCLRLAGRAPGDHFLGVMGTAVCTSMSKRDAWLNYVELRTHFAEPGKDEINQVQFAIVADPTMGKKQLRL